MGIFIQGDVKRLTNRIHRLERIKSVNCVEEKFGQIKKKRRCKRKRLYVKIYCPMRNTQVNTNLLYLSDDNTMRLLFQFTESTKGVWWVVLCIK